MKTTIGKIALTVLFAGGIASLTYPAVRSVQRDLHVERTVSTLRTALEQYRAAHGRYVADSPRTAVELVEVLLEAGALREPPRNPYTGQPYGSDPFEVDRIWYTTNDAATRFELEALRPGGTDTLLVVRSKPDA